MKVPHAVFNAAKVALAKNIGERKPGFKRQVWPDLNWA